MARLLMLIALLFGPSLFAQGTHEGEKQAEPVDEPQAKDSTGEPSLAELARQTREKRSKSGTEVRVITNKDLIQMRGSRVTTSRTPPSEKAIENSSDGTTGNDETKKGDQQTQPEGPDMQEWAQAFREARGVLQGAVNRTLVLELRLNNLRNAYFGQADGNTAEMLQSQLGKTNDELQQARQDEDQARQAMQQLEREALAAGLAPGEVRDLKGEIKESSSAVDLTPEQLMEMPQ